MGSNRLSVTPAKAGVQVFREQWIPAVAGMTLWGCWPVHNRMTPYALTSTTPPRRLRKAMKGATVCRSNPRVAANGWRPILRWWRPSHGLAIFCPRRTVPTEVAKLARGQHAGRSAALGPGRRFCLPARLAAQALRRRLGRHQLAHGIRRPGRHPDRAGHLRAGNDPRPRPRNPPTAWASASSAPPSWRTAPKPRSNATSPKSSTPTKSGARASRNPIPAQTWRRCKPRRCWTATTSWSTARKSGPAWGSTPTGASCWCAPTPRLPGTAAFPTCWSTCTAPASPCVP